MKDFRELNLVGRSPAFLDALNLITKFATCDATVLIQGETGTGKELAARAIHYLGVRRDGPFIPVNCGAIPDNLLENELFGHVRGAFTDARESQSGLVANAEGGTLFLDEIESLSAKGQVVLLRFLQDRVYRPLGARAHVAGNVRVIAASNKSAADLLRSEEFRQDLLYRLAILSVRMPALRERFGDPTLLARHFIRRFAGQYQQTERALDNYSIDLLGCHIWPGNVRELENLIQRQLLTNEGPALHLESSDLEIIPKGGATAGPQTQLPMRFELGFRRAKALVIAEFERNFLLRALSESKGNVSAAARLIKKERRAFGRLLRKHGIDRAAFG